MTPSQIWPAIGWSSYCDKRKLWSLRKALFECEKSSLRIGMRAHPATHMSWVWGCWRPLALRPGCSQVLRLFLDPQFSSWRLQRPLSPRRKGLICVEPEVEIRYSKHKQESPIWKYSMAIWLGMFGRELRSSGKFWKKEKKRRFRMDCAGFPGGAVVKNPPANAGDTGSSPGPGRSHMSWSNQARAPQLLSLRSRAREPQLLKPTCCNYWSQCA